MPAEAFELELQLLPKTPAFHIPGQILDLTSLHDHVNQFLKIEKYIAVQSLTLLWPREL